MLHKNHKLMAAFVSVCMMVCMIPFMVFADVPADGVYHVTSQSELTSAVDEINAIASGEYTLSIEADFEINGSFSFNQPVTVTIIGNNHTISNLNRITVSNGTLNLGSPDNNTTLTFTGVKDNDLPGMLIINSVSAIVNMYDGVTFTGHEGNNYFGGGATVNRGTFNMYGGTISNCGIKNGGVCFGGGVAINYGGLFNMYGGEIKDCYATTTYTANNVGLIPCGAGGGVFVGGGSTFNMSGGKITNCTTSETGGGVFVVASKDTYFNHSAFGYLDSSFTMSGGEISNCSAPYYGGGVAISGYYVDAYAIATANGTAGVPSNPGVYLTGGTISGNTADSGAGLFAIQLNNSIPFDICNNISNNLAESDSSDVFLQKVTVRNFVDPSSFDEVYLGEPSDITNETIDGYYWDENARFVDLAVDEREKASESDIKLYAAASSVSLIAAANPTNVTLTFDNLGIGPTLEPVKVTMGEITTAPTDAPWNIGDEYTTANNKTYTFHGWYTDNTFVTEFDWTQPLTEDTTIYAKWVYDDYIATFDIDKTYVIADGYENAGDVFDTEGILMEDVTFTITPYASFNREVGMTTIPAFSETTYTISVGDGSDVATVELPDFTGCGVGDYWYEVAEVTGTSTGVTYDSNNYYLHVVVSRENELDYTSYGVSQVTLHKTAPETDGTYLNAEDDKVTGFTNEYAIGDVTITKTVTGNMSDPSKLFAVTITLTASDGTTVNTPIHYEGGFLADGTAITNGVIDAGWTGTKTITVYLKKDSTVTFTDLANTVTYSVVETDYSNDGYNLPVFTVTNNEAGDAALTGSTWGDNKATGTISDDLDGVGIQNTKTATVDIGVVTDNAPFVIAIVTAVAAGVVLVLVNRKKSVEI